MCTVIKLGEIRNSRLDELKLSRQKCGYPVSIINNEIEKARNIPISELRTVNERNTEDSIPLITTHNPNNPPVNSIVETFYQ